MVWATYRKNDRLMVSTEDDVDNLAGFVAFETNHLEAKDRCRHADWMSCRESTSILGRIAKNSVRVTDLMTADNANRDQGHEGPSWSRSGPMTRVHDKL